MLRDISTYSLFFAYRSSRETFKLEVPGADRKTDLLRLLGQWYRGVVLRWTVEASFAHHLLYYSKCYRNIFNFIS